MDCDFFLRFAKLSSFNYLYNKNTMNFFNKPLMCRVDDFIKNLNNAPKLPTPQNLSARHPSNFSPFNKNFNDTTHNIFPSPPSNNNFSVDCLLNPSDSSSSTSDSPHSSRTMPDHSNAG